jgi:membrane-bound lytic murein transglycosylase A
LVACFYRRLSRAWVVAIFWAVLMVPPIYADVTHTVMDFCQLDGWDTDDHAAALRTFRNTCRDMKDVDWRNLCKFAETDPDPRQLFEMFFRPLLIEDGQEALFTGYFEPELDGDISPSSRYRYPIYAMPEEVKDDTPWLTRRDILDTDVMKGRGLEISYVDGPVERFFLQIQESSRIRLPGGKHIRVGYRGENGHPYRSIGVELVRRGVYDAHKVSADVIENWVRRNLEDGRELLYHNRSYVFFARSAKSLPKKGLLVR